MSVARRLGPSSENTRSAVLDLIRSSGIVSRIELADMSGLTATSITRIIKSLIDEGLIVETGFGDSTGGKRPSLIELNLPSRFAVGVSLDDARLTYVVTDLGGNVVGQVVTPGIRQAAPSVVLARMAEELDQLFQDLDIPVAGVVGVGVAGAGLDIRGGAERLSLTVDDWESFAVQEALESQIGLPVVRDNDASCAALGQFWAGRMPATQDFATLYMSNGFGLGLMANGNLSRGSSSNVGEIGHMVLDIDGPPCWCGSRGCLEMLAAPRAVVAQALGDPELAAALSITGGERNLRHDFDQIARAAARGEAGCLALIERSARYVAAAMLSVVNLLDLDRIYLAGPGFADAGAIYVRHIREHIASHARTRDLHGVSVELSDPGLDAAAVGAASLALQHVLTPHARLDRPVAGASAQT
ncbi:ROK family transcriptional regulator [Microbacterium sp. SA39]|uniref:ROK family transcriptional regulator n=1 Tax=Microbacterium sp. SA39 TaxID=1263625 RepID=UPI0005FA89D2|nr:ROK family transcriptional regulator [Microbacterium sp. SA39]KJQ52776.1 N-acetylglucosamine repressor [Microbacterium sp. SA39]